MHRNMVTNVGILSGSSFAAVLGRPTLQALRIDQPPALRDLRETPERARRSR